MDLSKVPKKYVKALSYIDILAGGLLFLMSILGFIVILITDINPETGPAEFLLGMVPGVILFFSGLILAESDLKGYKTKLGWVGAIYGLLFIFDSFINYIAPLEAVEKTVFLVVAPIVLIGYLIMTLVGYYLRELF